MKRKVGVRRVGGRVYYDTGRGYSAKAEARYFALEDYRRRGRHAIVVPRRTGEIGLRYSYQIYATKPRKKK